MSENLQKQAEDFARRLASPSPRRETESKRDEARIVDQAGKVVSPQQGGAKPFKP